MSDKKIVESWKINAQPWIATIRGHAIESRRLVTDKAIVNAVCSRNPATGIDVGCGEGWLIRSLQGIRMTGIDVVSDLIERASQECEGDFRVMAYEDLGSAMRGQTFDVAVCNFSLLGKESVEAVFRASPKLLNPGGALGT